MPEKNDDSKEVQPCCPGGQKDDSKAAGPCCSGGGASDGTSCCPPAPGPGRKHPCPSLKSLIVMFIILMAIAVAAHSLFKKDDAEPNSEPQTDKTESTQPASRPPSFTTNRSSSTVSLGRFDIKFHWFGIPGV